MRKRSRMSKRNSKKVFRRSATSTHTKNFRSPVMRGGIRL